MSVIIAIRETEQHPISGKTMAKIVIGTGSQTTTGHLRTSRNENTPKIFPVKNAPGVIMGCTGVARIGQVLSIQKDLIEKVAVLKKAIDTEYMIDKMHLKICEVLQKYHVIDKDTWTLEVNSLIAYQDQAWVLMPRGYVFTIDDHLVIGSGEEVALGVLEANKNKPAKERIKEAIQACANKTIYVDDKIQFMETEPIEISQGE